MASDLKLEPGDHLLDRLVTQPIPEPPASPPAALSLKPSIDKEPEGKDRVKVSLYLTAKQRDQYDLLLVHSRSLLPKAEGRRLDQSALIRIILNGVLEDFYAHQSNIEQSRLAQWLLNAGEPE